ncbi:hypothetical protein NS330_03130 [Curtobacterium citreum]|nr:hypothetical protein NS330_03130 [Curtobacterium citreum]
MTTTELFEAWAQACVKKDVDAIADLYAEDGVHTFAFRQGAPSFHGREKIRQMLAEGFGQAPVNFTGIADLVVHRTEDPNTIVAEFAFEGQTHGGYPIRPTYIEIFTARDGKIAAVRDYENLAYRAQSES